MPSVDKKYKEMEQPKGKNLYISKCIKILMKEGKSQAAAIGACEGFWRSNWQEKKAKGSLEEPSWDENESGPFVLLP
jgi:hypothetical protein